VTDQTPDAQPEHGDRIRRFTDVGEALAYFRVRYGDVAGAIRRGR
jgi:hypothetical protein